MEPLFPLKMSGKTVCLSHDSDRRISWHVSLESVISPARTRDMQTDNISNENSKLCNLPQSKIDNVCHCPIITVSLGNTGRTPTFFALRQGTSLDYGSRTDH